ncbi:TVP38/TMEM64 family protein [Paracoccus liaowanqingii]|uniref:TVP38/TMEM64 family membrane protein n=1 Tax=Paracoccus liaowanqingii TaxID=2560053 RepID=A0A4Z1CEY9_9RHOB|nr:VTT domain-containing protein [Paracoccus liaowanqingii]TGN55298.1 TVP38/TMEM64 family protein [Paracoccus liaowanqingii]
MTPLRIALGAAAGVAALAAALWLWPSLPALQSDLTRLHRMLEHGQGWRDRNHELAVLAYLGGFAVLGALPFPVVVLMTLAGGAFFGFWLGLVLSMLGTMMAATLTFLAARHLLTGQVRRLLGARLDQLDRRVEADGALALLSLRLTPAIPFFVLNLAAGVSALAARVFIPVTAAGVLPNKAILSAAGTQLAELDQVSDIVGPRIIAVIVALTLFPWIARWLSRRLRRRPAEPTA